MLDSADQRQSLIWDFHWTVDVLKGRGERVMPNADKKRERSKVGHGLKRHKKLDRR